MNLAEQILESQKVRGKDSISYQIGYKNARDLRAPYPYPASIINATDYFLGYDQALKDYNLVLESELCEECGNEKYSDECIQECGSAQYGFSS